MDGGGAAVLVATSISSEVARCLGTRARIRVHSAFARAVNLCLEGSVPAQLPLGMVTLARQEVGNLPNGILVSAGAMPLRSLVGERHSVWLEGGRLYLEGGEVDLRGARSWDASLKGLRGRGWGAGWRGRWALAWRSLSLAVGAVPASPLWGVAAGRVERLVDALEGCALGEAIDAARGLVGLGPGLTPSGDDLLVGLLVGLQGRPVSDQQGRLVATWGKSVVASAHRTTDVSRVYLDWAARGWATQRLRDVAEAVLCPGVEGRLDAAVAAGLDVGSTSGADGLLGLLLGLRMWMNESEEDDANAT